MGAFELLMMRAETADAYAVLVRGIHIPITVLVVSEVLFVWIFLRAGRRALGWAVIATRSAALLINFLRPPNLNFVEMHDPVRITFLGEEVSVANGIVSSWTRLGELNSLLLLVFLVDATVQLLRRGHRRRGAISAAIFAFVLGSAGVTSLTHAGVVTWPYALSFGFLGVMIVMTYDLSSEVLRSTRLSQQLATRETALRERDGQLALASAIPELTFWSWDAAKDEVWMTENGRRQRGYGPQQRPRLEDLVATLHPDDRDGFTRDLRGLKPGERFHREHRIVAADGKTRWINAIGRAEADESGVAAGIHGVSIDVTARKLAEIESQRQRSEIAHLARLTTLGEFSGSLAHELSQPLAAILSNAQAAQRILSSNGEVPAQLKEILEDIVRDDKHAGEVIRRLRTFLKKGEGEFEILDPQQIIAEGLRLIRTDLLHRGVSVETEISPELPPIRADRVQIQQVLVNLVSNACDAMAQLEPGMRRLALRAEPDGTGIRISVADRGSGIPEGEQDRIFAPFVTTKDSGMGLGLAVCRTIVGSHGGRLWAANNPGGGATFAFTIPSAGEARA
jgi:signal transduction histidine kinase